MRIYLRRFEKKRKSEDLIRACLLHYTEELFPQIDRDRIRSAFIQRTEKGKPSLPDFPEIHFSVSHSGSLWGCAFHTLPVGFDLEVSADRMLKKRPDRNEERWMSIARRFFHPEECAYIRTHGREAFFRIWVRKEAFVKHSGGGIASGLDRFSVIRDGVFLEKMGNHDCIEIDLSPAKLPDGVVAACFGENIATYTLQLFEPLTDSTEERQYDGK